MTHFVHNTVGIILTEEKRNTRGATCSTATLSTTESTWTDLGSIQGLLRKKPSDCPAQPYVK